MEGNRVNQVSENTLDNDRLLSLRELSEYSNLSVGTLKSRLKKTERNSNPLICFNIGRKILVRKSDFNEWLEANCKDYSQERVDKVVSAVMDRLKL